MIKNSSDISNSAEQVVSATPNIQFSYSSTVPGSLQSGISADRSKTTPVESEEGPQLRLIWKAYIQTPVRLSERDAYPVGRPECPQTEMQRHTVPSNMQNTIQAYKMMLPNLAGNLNIKRDLDVSRLSHSISVTHAFQLKKPKHTRRPQRFLKSAPKGGSVAELHRSAHFENLLLQFERRQFSGLQSAFFSDQSSVESVPTTSEGQVSNINEPVSEKHPSEIMRGRSRSASSKNTYQSILTKSLSKIQSMFPIAPYRSNVQRRVTILNSMKDQRIITAITDMVDGTMTRMQSYEVTDDDSLESVRRRETSYRTSRYRFHKGKATVSGSPQCLVPHVIDTDAIVPGSVVLETKIREHDMHQFLEIENLDYIRKVYTQSLLKQPSLKKLLTQNRLDALPKPLRTVVRVGKIYRHENFDEKFKTDNKPIATNEMFCPIKENLSDTALGDAECLWLEAKLFTSGLYKWWMSTAGINHQLTDMQEAELLNEFHHLARALRQSITCPTSSHRLEMLSTLKTCAMFPELQPSLWATVDDWLENLLSGLYSPDRTVREQTCYVLAYLFTQRELVQGIRQHVAVDLAYDCTMAVLQAIEISPATFIHYYCLLALMVEGCPMFSLLNAIIDSGVQSSSQLLRHLWPRLIYYALRYWNPRHFTKDRMTLRVLNECIEKAYVKGISRKNAKLAQIQLSKRFKVITKPITVWLDEWAIFGQ